MHRYLLLPSLLLLLFAFAGDQPKFSARVYGNVANYFENEQDLLTFFDFHKGDVIAEVGAATGKNLAGLALLADSLTFYAEDIDKKTLTQKNLDAAVNRVRKYKNPVTSTFQLTIGTETATGLPANTFDKILLIATLHEFTHATEMMADICSKLKPGGKVYVLESICLAHKNYSAEQTIALMQAHKLQLIKKDGKDLNGSSGLYRAIFVK